VRAVTLGQGLTVKNPRHIQGSMHTATPLFRAIHTPWAEVGRWREGGGAGESGCDEGGGGEAARLLAVGKHVVRSSCNALVGEQTSECPFDVPHGRHGGDAWNSSEGPLLGGWKDAPLVTSTANDGRWIQRQSGARVDRSGWWPA